METKSHQIAKAMDAGDHKKAISIASKFFDRSEDTKLFSQAQSAINSPSFYTQIGKDPGMIIDEALKVIKEKFCNAAPSS
jgi:hypothetical protein